MDTRLCDNCTSDQHCALFLVYALGLGHLMTATAGDSDDDFMAGSPSSFAISLQSLPHRYPFLFLDKVLQIERGVSISALKNVAFSDCGGGGELPEMLMLESIGQAGAVLLSATMTLPREGGLMVMVAIESVSFAGSPVPGDRATITATILGLRNYAAQISGEFQVESHVHCAARLLCQIVPHPGAHHPV